VNTMFEDHLTLALRAEATGADEPGPDFFAAVSRGVRRRRRQRGAVTAGVVACALVATTGTAATVLSMDGSILPRPDPTAQAPALPPADPARVPDWANLPDVGTVWPNALRRLPGRLPDGSPYMVEAILPGNRYIVLKWNEMPPGFTLSDPAIFDPAAGTVTPLGGPSRPGDTMRPGVAVVGDLAVWVNLRTSDVDSPTTVAEIWTAPLAGGPVRKIATAEATDFTIAGGYLMWTRMEGTRYAGIYRVPVTGGQAELVPGTDGFRIGRYAGLGGASAVASKNTASGGELIDLVTGRRFTWTLSRDVAPGEPAGTNFMSCGLVGCTGEWGTLGPSGRADAVVQNLDGSGYLALGNGSVAPVGAGRFVRFTTNIHPLTEGKVPEYRVALWDRITGRAAHLYQTKAGDGPGSSTWVPGRESGTRPFVTWGDNGNLVLLDLTAAV
jgi:hypothetical protein